MMKTILLFYALLFFSGFSVAQPDWSAYGGIPNADTRLSVIDGGFNKWVAMFGGGISKFKPDETWDNYNSSNSGMPENFALCVTIDGADNKWIGTNSSGVVVYNGTNWTVYNSSNGLPGNKINCISIDASNNKWFGINLNGVTKFDGSTFTTYNTGNSSLPNNNVNCITIDANGNKWIGTYDGLAKYNGTTWTVYPVGTTAADHQIYSVTIESPTVIWVGTGGGLWKFDGNSTWTNYNTGNSGLPYNYVNCVAIDQYGTKWIGTTQGGMAQFDGTSSWTVYNTTNSNIPGMNIRNIVVDSNNNLWVCSNGGFAFYGVIPGISTDATLSDLKVNNITVSGFSPSVYTYNIELPFGTTALPVVTATTNHYLATKIITDATSLPGTATVAVTAEDGITTLTYTLNFTVAAANTDASLSDLQINGVTVSGFVSTTYDYNVELPYGTTIVPTTTAIPSFVNSTIQITDAVSLPGTTTITVTAEDGISTNIYNIHFTVSTGIEIINYNSTIIYPNPSKGEFVIETESGASLSITDVMNKVLLCKKINNYSTLINLNNFASGIYFIQIEKDGKIFFNKLIIQH